MNLNKKNKKIIVIFTSALALATFFILVWWVYPYLTSDKLRSFVEESGVLGPLVLMAYVVFAHVVAPLGGLPAFVVGVAVFGVVKTSIYIYIASMVSAVINFYISRRFGRPLVKYLVGEKGIKKVDEWGKLLGRKVLLLGRVLGLFLFEELSYAAGLTTMSFKSFMAITIFGTAIPTFILMFSFRNIDFGSATFSTLSTIVIFVVGVASAGLLVWYVRSKAKKGSDVEVPEISNEHL